MNIAGTLNPRRVTDMAGKSTARHNRRRQVTVRCVYLAFAIRAPQQAAWKDEADRFIVLF